MSSVNGSSASRDELRRSGVTLPRSSTSASVSTTHRTAGFGQPRVGGVERLAMVVHLRAVVEHDQPRGRVAGQHQFDGVVEIVDARGDHARLGLGDDGPQFG